MIESETVLAVIPARAGSKRVPHKNRQSYRGTWLVEYAHNAAKGSKYIDHTVLSSDCDQILDMGKHIGLEGVKRPGWLADDKATSESVLIHTLYTFCWADWVVLLQPTSPLRISEDIDTCLERARLGHGCITYNQKGARNGAVYVTRSQHLVSRAEFSKDTFDQFLIMPDARSLDIDYPQDFNQ